MYHVGELKFDNWKHREGLYKVNQKHFVREFPEKSTKIHHLAIPIQSFNKIKVDPSIHNENESKPLIILPMMDEFSREYMTLPLSNKKAYICRM